MPQPSQAKYPESALLQLICLGLTNKQIGQRFGVSEKAVKSRLTRIYVKYGCVNRTQLATRFLNESGALHQKEFETQVME